MKAILLFLILLTGEVMGQGDSDARFVQISAHVAVANKQMATRLKSAIWDSAENAWSPLPEEVLAGLRHLMTASGREEILSKAPAGIDMRPCLERVEEKRFQVFGLVIEGRKCLVYDGIPQITTSEINKPELWLKESISRRMVDGGADFWSFVYVPEEERIISAGRRPD